MYAEMAMIEEPSCGVRVVAETWSLRCLGACMLMALFYVPRLIPRIVLADHRFVVGSSLGYVCICLYSFCVSLHID